MAHSSSAEHVVVIGGGATGALIAVGLAERGFRVTVVEKAQVGNGSSSRSAAGIRAQFSTEETVVGMQYSEWWYSHFHDLLHSAPDVRAQPVMRQNGYLFLYEDPDAVPAWQPRSGRELARIWQLAQVAAHRQRRVGLAGEVCTPRVGRVTLPRRASVALPGATWGPPAPSR